jgi:tRNA(Ile)-lysidine synthase
VALVRMLIELQAQFHLEPLILAHLNHQLRGDESDADEVFVEELTHSLQGVASGELRLVRHQIDVKAEAMRSRDNLEKTARENRYSWLAQVAGEFKTRWIATGHTANDQAETILHRIIRGSGLKGLRGIAGRRQLGKELYVIRPMLDVTRSEVMEYLDEKKQPYCLDSSNLDRRLTRNRIRHDLLPLLERDFNHAIVSSLCHLAEQAAEEYSRMEAKAEQLLTKTELQRAGVVLIFNRQALSQAPRALVREVFRLVWNREGWPMARMGFDEWERLAAVACGESSAVDLPGGIRAIAQPRVVQIGRLP